jgi:hypothetical protein
MRVLCFVLFSLLSSQLEAHEYFFGFAELEYNSVDNRYEGTLILSQHDLEHWLESKNFTFSNLESEKENTKVLLELEPLLFDGFQVYSIDQTELIFSLQAFEIRPDGMVQFYFESETTPELYELKVRFDLMMDEFPEQQNKLMVLKNEQTFTSVFMRQSKEAKIVIQ